MNTLEPFSSSLDWGTAFVDSLIWIVRAWAIAAFCTVSVLALIARFTTWGQQFWNVTGAYFAGLHSVKVWAWLGGILLSVITGVRLVNGGLGLQALWALTLLTCCQLVLRAATRRVVVQGG